MTVVASAGVRTLTCFRSLDHTYTECMSLLRHNLQFLAHICLDAILVACLFVPLSGGVLCGWFDRIDAQHSPLREKGHVQMIAGAFLGPRYVHRKAYRGCCAVVFFVCVVGQLAVSCCAAGG